MSGEWTPERGLLILRVVAMRKAGRMGIVLMDPGYIWLAENPADPWGPDKRRLSWDSLRELVEAAEASVPRKQPLCETEPLRPRSLAESA